VDKQNALKLHGKLKYINKQEVKSKSLILQVSMKDPL